MMYRVTAKLKEEKAKQFLAALEDGTIGNQEPDGQEMLSAMQRAVIREDSVVQWSEMCFCPTPLKHERETVYDTYFDEFETEEIDAYEEYEGHSFLEHLKQLAEGQA